MFLDLHDFSTGFGIWDSGLRLLFNMFAARRTNHKVSVCREGFRFVLLGFEPCHYLEGEGIM